MKPCGTPVSATAEAAGVAAELGPRLRVTTGASTFPATVNLWPVNIALLHSRGVAFTWRRAEHDLQGACPLCASVLTIHESEPWHFCAGITCNAHVYTFAEMIAALPVDQVRDDSSRAGRQDGCSPIIDPTNGNPR